MSVEAWTVVFGFGGLLINGVGLGFLGVQVTLARRQAARAQESEAVELVLRRKESTISFLVATLEQRRAMRHTLPDDFDEGAVAAFIDRAADGKDPTLDVALDGYLWYMETLALGVTSGVYDFETVLYMLGARISAIAENYQRHMERRRRETGVHTLYVEIEALGRKLRRVADDLPQRGDWASAHETSR